ncbi:MAG: hypothetical protein ACOCQ5_00390 [Halanaerobiales bacterium]
MDQVLNSIRQVKQNLNSLNSRLNQLHQRISQDQNEFNEISQIFDQSFQELNNCERIAQSINQHQYSTTPGTNYTAGNNYQTGTTAQPGMTGRVNSQLTNQTYTPGNQMRTGMRAGGRSQYQGQYQGQRNQNLGSSYNMRGLQSSQYNTGNMRNPQSPQFNTSSGTTGYGTTGIGTGSNQISTQTPVNNNFNTRGNNLGSAYQNMKSGNASTQYSGMNTV